jgi:hypothetical protein
LKNADCALRDGRKKMRPPQGKRKRPVKSPQEPFGLRRPRLLRGRLEARPRHFQQTVRVGRNASNFGNDVPSGRPSRRGLERRPLLRTNGNYRGTRPKPVRAEEAPSFQAPSRSARSWHIALQVELLALGLAVPLQPHLQCLRRPAVALGLITYALMGSAARAMWNDEWTHTVRPAGETWTYRFVVTGASAGGAHAVGADGTTRSGAPLSRRPDGPALPLPRLAVPARSWTSRHSGHTCTPSQPAAA